MKTDQTTPRPLTPNEKKVLEFIEQHFSVKGFAPSFSEIKENFGFASFNSVQRYLQQLEDKGYLKVPGGNKKRALQILHPASTLGEKVLHLHQQTNQQRSPQHPNSISTHSHPWAGIASSLPIPLLGRVAAGLPLEAVEHDTYVDVPSAMLKKAEETYALRVKGESMVEDGIFDGDLILVQKQEQARSGEIVVAMIDNEATVKRLYMHKQTEFSNEPKIELRPSNSTMQSMWYDPSQVDIRGIVVGLMRSY